MEDFSRRVKDMLNSHEKSSNTGQPDGAPNEDVVTPELSEQSGSCSSPSGQADLSQPVDTTSALMSIFGGANNSTPSTSITSVASFDLPLGSDLSEKTKIKIKNREYINLSSLLHSEPETSPFNISSQNGIEITFKANNKRVPLSIEKWTNAMLVYAAVYIEAHPTDLNPLLTYVTFVRNMARKAHGNAWQTYDETFRRVRETTPIPWDKPLINQYFEAIVTGLQQPFRSGPSKPQRRQSNAILPLGYCYKYHENNCSFKFCKYKHICPMCNGQHPIKLSTQNRQLKSPAGAKPNNITK